MEAQVDKDREGAEAEIANGKRKAEKADEENEKPVIDVQPKEDGLFS